MLKSIRFACATALSAVLAFNPLAASACTSFMLKADNGDVVTGRTMEFAMPLNSQLIVIPRNLAIKGVGPDGNAGTGLTYTTKYGVTGANALGLPVIVDGMNEKGLYAGLLYFPGLAEFQDVTPAEAAQSIASYELATYILTQFATVDEVKAGLPKIKVNRAPQAAFKASVPLHATVHDANGKSVVIEYVGGQLQMTDNPTTVMTNSPSIGWHLANLAQYANVSSNPGADFRINGQSFKPWSSGTGMNGLPGDMSSASRFLRAAFYVANAPKMKDAAEGLTIAWHYVNQFDIPPGAVRTEAGGAGGGVAGYEVTEWASAADLKNGVYQLKTFGNQQIRQISLKSVDLDAKAVRFIPVDQTLGAIDLSK